MIGKFIVQKDVVETYVKKGTAETVTNRVLCLVEMGEHALSSILRYVVRREDKVPEANTAGKMVEVAVMGFRESWKGLEASGAFIGLAKSA